MKKTINKTDNNNNRTTFLTTLGLAKRAGKLVVGWDRISDYIGEINTIFVSSDASDRTLKNAKSKCDAIFTDYSMTELGSALGIKKVAVIAVTDSGFSTLLTSKLFEK